MRGDTKTCIGKCLVLPGAVWCRLAVLALLSATWCCLALVMVLVSVPLPQRIRTLDCLRSPCRNVIRPTATHHGVYFVVLALGSDIQKYIPANRVGLRHSCRLQTGPNRTHVVEFGPSVAQIGQNLVETTEIQTLSPDE